MLEWHGVDVERMNPCLSLSALCWLEGIRSEVLVRDLLAAHPDRDEEDLLQFLAEGAGVDADLEEVPVDPEPRSANDVRSWWDLAS